MVYFLKKPLRRLKKALHINVTKFSLTISVVKHKIQYRQKYTLFVIASLALTY